MREVNAPSDSQSVVVRLETGYRKHFILVLAVALALDMTYLAVVHYWLTIFSRPNAAELQQCPALLSQPDPAKLLQCPALLVQLTDPMSITGTLALVLILRLAVDFRSHLSGTLARLIARGSLELSHEQQEQLEKELERRATAFGWIGGAIVGGGYVLLVLWVKRGLGFENALGLIAVGITCGPIVGYYAGRLVAYGGLGRYLTRNKVVIKAQPGHLDGAAGMKPLGEFYFFQALALAIAALFFALWIMLIPLPAFLQDYGYNNDALSVLYLVLLMGALVMEFLAFLAPLWSFHRLMRNQKIELLSEADRLSQRIAQVKKQLAEGKTREELQMLEEQMSAMTDYYMAIINMPTWPIDVRTRRLFTLNNLALALPLISQIIVTAQPKAG